MTETAPSTFPPSVDQPQIFKNVPPANLHVNEQFPTSPSSLNDQSRGDHPVTAPPPAVNVLSNGDAHPLRALCAKLHSQIEAFLDENVKSARLQAVQAQTRRSLQIIQEALDRYPYSIPLSLRPPLPLHYPCPLQSSNIYLFSPSLTSLALQSFCVISLLQWWKGLPCPPHPLPFSPLRSSMPTTSPPGRLYLASPPFPRRRKLCHLFFRYLLSGIGAICAPYHA